MIELYEHNGEAYSNMQEMHKYENKVAIVHPTGTEKMYIAVKWLYENRDKNSLFLCPNIYTSVIKYNEEYKDIKIGSWKSSRRKEYKQGILSKEKELILRELGETFPNVHRIPKGPTVIDKDANLTIPSKKSVN